VRPIEAMGLVPPARGENVIVYNRRSGSWKRSQSSLRLGSFWLCCWSQSAPADVGADLNQAEGLYKAGQYAQAEQAYLKVIQEADPNKPADSEAAFTARKTLALVYVAMDRPAQAKDALQQLLGRYAGYESLPQAIHDLVEGAKPLYKAAQVRQLYHDMVTARPGDPQVIWLKMGVAIASVHLTDDPATDGVLQDIIARHGTDDRAVEALNHIAWACRKLKQYNKALRIYQYAVDNWGRKDRVAFSQHGIVICYLGLGNRPAADEAFNVLLQRFGKDKNASKLILWAGHGYADAGEIERACKIYEFLVQSYADTQEATDAQISLTITSAQAEDRTRIEPALQMLLTRFAPTEVKARGLHNLADTLVWKYFGYARQSAQRQDTLALIDRCLPAIANYTLATWPKSDWAMWAERDLAAVAIRAGDGPTAEAAINRLGTDYAGCKDTPGALKFLADYCLELSQHDKAEPVYQHLIQKYPGYELLPLVKAEIGVVQIYRGSDGNAEGILQKIMAEHANHARLGEAINLIALGYYGRARMGQARDRAASADDFRRALVVWEIVIRDLPQSPAAANAWYHSAVVYAQELGEHERALQYYQRVVESWSVAHRRPLPQTQEGWSHSRRSGRPTDGAGLSGRD
jgi:TolA-binding protein